MGLNDEVIHGDRSGFAVDYTVLICAVLMMGCSRETDRAFSDQQQVEVMPSAETVYTVGKLDGEAWESFGEIAGVAFGRDATLFVLDRDPARIVAIDARGRFVRTIAGEGGGPGELLQPAGLAVLRDGRIGVLDHAKRALSVFTVGGDFLDATPYGPSDDMPGPTIHAGDDRSIIATPIGSGRRQRPGRPIVRFNLDGSRQVLYWAWDRPVSGRQTGRQVRAGGLRLTITGGGSAFPIPLQFAVLLDGRVVVSDSIGYRIKILARDGTVLHSVDRPVAPIAVTPEIEMAERDRRLARIEIDMLGGSTVAVTGTGSVDPAALRRALFDAATQQIEELVFPDEIPVIERLAVDWSDRIWIRRAARPGEEGPIDVISGDGRYVGTIPAGAFEIPAAFGPNDMLAYIDVDELGIQRVRVAVLGGL